MIKDFRKWLALFPLMIVIPILPECTFKKLYVNFIEKYIHLL